MQRNGPAPEPINYHSPSSRRRGSWAPPGSRLEHLLTQAAIVAVSLGAMTRRSVAIWFSQPLALTIFPPPLTWWFLSLDEERVQWRCPLWLSRTFSHRLMALLPVLPTLPTELLEPPSLRAHTLKVPSQNGDTTQGTLLHWMTLSCLFAHPLSIERSHNPMLCLLQHPLFLIGLLLFTRHLLSAGYLERKDKSCTPATWQIGRRFLAPVHFFFKSQPLPISFWL